MLQSFKYKIHFLEKSTNRVPVPLILGILSKKLDETSIKLRISERQKELIAFDLAYILVRHQKWLSAPLFPEFVTDFLSQMFHWPRSVGLEFWTTGMAEISEKCPGFLPPPVTTNRPFLESVFIASATAANQKDLEIDLGLGSSLLQSIRVSAEGVMGIKRSDGDLVAVEFPSTVESDLESIMKDIADELKVTPWLLDVYRFRDRLTSTLVQNELTLSEWHKRFHLLLKIGQHTLVTRDKVLAWWSALKGDNGESVMIAQETDEIITLFQQYDLIFGEPQSRKPGQWQWFLTPEGLALTAEANAIKLVRNKNVRIARILKLNETYQVAFLKRLQFNWETTLQTMLRDHQKQLGPIALAAIMERFIAGDREGLIAPILGDIMQSHRSQWYRSELHRSLNNIPYDRSASRILESLAEVPSNL